MKNKTFWDSIKCACSGLVYAIKTEKNFKYYFVIAFVFLALNLFCNINFAGYLAYFITVGGVFSSECINTSIEHLADMQDTNIRPEIKWIKDMAAAAVLCWGFAFFACELYSIGGALCLF